MSVCNLAYFRCLSSGFFRPRLDREPAGNHYYLYIIVKVRTFASFEACHPDCLVAVVCPLAPADMSG
jgi:hypothetical protein